MKEEKITGGGGRGGTDLLMECDEDEEEVCPQSKLKEKVEEKKTGPDEAVKTTNDQKLEYFSLVRIIPIPVKPSSSSSSSSPASHDNTHNNIEGSDAPLGFKVNGQLISLPPGGGATVLKMSSNPGGSASGFTTVQLPVSPEVDNPTESWNMDNSYPNAPTAAAGLELEPTPIITGVVSGEAAQKVLSEHSANFKSRKNAPSASSRASATLSRKPSPVHSSSTTAAHYRLLKRGQLDPLPPPDCLTCKSPFKLIPELRGFMCLCSPAIAESLENIKKKKERLIMKRQRRRREKRMFNSLTNPLESSSGAGLQCFSATKVISPPQKIYRLSDEFMSSRILKQEQDEPPVDTPQGKLVILVEDFYYGSVQGSNRYTVMDDGYNGPYDCIYCQSTLPDNIKLMNHILKHVTLVSNQDRIRDSVFPCHHCLRHFPSSFKRQCHIEDVHSQCETTAKCKICELSFGNEGAFLWHMKSTHKPGEMPYTCKVCNFRSSFYSDVWSHFENAHRVTKHLLCPFCLRVMSDNTCYQHHVAQHQKKHVFDCDMCRLHFLYLNERVKHKEMHHITYIKPAQLNGLKPGTKVTVRTFSMSGQSEENLKKTGPCKVVDVDPPPSRQGASKRKLVESLGELLSTLSQESESAGISHPSPRCVECLSSVQDFSTHFPSLVRCSICSFITCCSTAYANHMINNHANRSETPLYTSIYLPQPRLSDRLSCGSCSFSTYRGDVMANHLTEKQEHHCIMLQHNEPRVTVDKPTTQGTNISQSVRSPIPQRGGAFIPIDRLRSDQTSSRLSVKRVPFPSPSSHPPAMTIKFLGPCKQTEVFNLSGSQLSVVLYALCHGLPQASHQYQTPPQVVQSWIRQQERGVSDRKWLWRTDKLAEWVLSQREQQLEVSGNALLQAARAALGEESQFEDRYCWTVDFLLRHQLRLQPANTADLQQKRRLPKYMRDKCRCFLQTLSEQIQSFPLHCVAAMDEFPIFIDADLFSIQDPSALQLFGSPEDKPMMEIVFSALSDGTFLPPLLFFSGKPSQVPDGFPNNILLEAQQEGLTEQERLNLWIKKVWRPHMSARCNSESVMLVDVHHGHLSEEFRRGLFSEYTDAIFIPSGCSCRLQPLDICVTPVLRDFLQARWAQLVSEGLDSLTLEQLVLTLTCWISEVCFTLNAEKQILRRSFASACSHQEVEEQGGISRLIHDLTEALIQPLETSESPPEPEQELELLLVMEETGEGGTLQEEKRTEEEKMETMEEGGTIEEKRKEELAEEGKKIGKETKKMKEEKIVDRERIEKDELRGEEATTGEH